MTKKEIRNVTLAIAAIVGIYTSTFVAVINQKTDIITPPILEESVNINQTRYLKRVSDSVEDKAVHRRVFIVYKDTEPVEIEIPAPKVVEAENKKPKETKTVQKADTKEKKESNDDSSMELIGKFRLTGYYLDGQTAIGVKPTPGRTVAMNDSERKELGLEYGDRIYIEGVGYRIIEDCGCSEGTVDVYVNNKDEAYALTKKGVRVYRG